MTTEAAPPTVATGPVAPADAGPRGIGGWLILPILGFIGTILLTGWSLAQSGQAYAGLFAIFVGATDQLAQLRVPTAASLIGGILVVASAAGCLYLIFARKRAIIRFATAHYLILAVAGLVDLWAGFVMERVLAEPNDPSAIKEAIRGVVAAIIWIPYFHASRRVRNTFVN